MALALFLGGGGFCTTGMQIHDSNMIGLGVAFGVAGAVVAISRFFS